jgi:glycosyltransferase involved in cell wall biosynthesis
MKIAIDARWIFPRMSGIGRVTENLITHLGRIDRENRYLVLFNDDSLRARYGETWKGHPNLETTLIPWSIFSPLGQIGLAPFLRRAGADVFHSTNYFIPLSLRGPKAVITIHDLIPLMFPEFTPRAKKTRFHFFFRWVIRRCVRRADRVIAPSRCTKNDILSRLGVPEPKVAVVYNGVDEKYRPLDPAAARRRLPSAVDPSVPFALFVGRLDPYKNAAALVRAFAIFLRETGEDGRLVLASHRDARYPEVFAEIGASGCSDRIVFLDGISEEEIIALYASARAVVLPSLYEGFGLPPLEAMACGAAVICSDRGALPEVVGEAALIAAPVPEALAAALKRIWRDEKLRSDLRGKGLRRAAQFSWEKTAREHLAVYQSL